MALRELWGLGTRYHFAGIGSGNPAKRGCEFTKAEIGAAEMQTAAPFGERRRLVWICCGSLVSGSVAGFADLYFPGASCAFAKASGFAGAVAEVEELGTANAGVAFDFDGGHFG